VKDACACGSGLPSPACCARYHAGERAPTALALMRSRQHDDTLFWAPYSVADQWRIVNGEMPERLGDASSLDVQAPAAESVVELNRETR